jgi:hypothetical protein
VPGDDAELIRRMIGLFNRLLEPETDELRAETERVWAAEPEIVPMRAALEGRSYRGPDALEEFRAASMETWSELHLDLDELEGDGPRYLCSGMLRGRGRESGVEFTSRAWAVIDIEAGRVQRVSTSLDGERARAEFAGES